MTLIIFIASYFAAGLLALGMVFAFIRLLKGPSLPDRIVALDVIATAAIGILVITAINTDQAVLLDISLAMALITFIGTIALAISLERGLFK